MSHAAAIYNVRVHPARKPKDLLLLGDYDGSTTWLGETINGIFGSGTFRNSSANAEKRIACVETKIVGEEIHSTFTHGQSGQAAEILNDAEELQFEQRPEHINQMRCGSVFRLDRNQNMGWWAVHVNNGRSAQGLTSRMLQELFKDQQEGLLLKITPSVPTNALIEAVKGGHLESVQLTRHISPADRAEGAVDNWVEAAGKAKIEVKIKGLDRNLVPDMITKWFGERTTDNFGDIVSFGNVEFEQAKVAVRLENGKQRTFNIERPDAGHAFTQELSLPVEPTDAQVYKALSGVLQELG